ncbi:MAG: LiaF-related protein [Marinoscillum sp.]
METKRRSILGLILVLLGAVLLLNNLDLIPEIPYFVFHWSNIFIVLALINFLSGNRKPALIFVVLWIFFFSREFYYFSVQDYWPLILVAIGLSFLVKNKQAGKPIVEDAYFDDINIFGGSYKKFTSQQLQGGKSTNMFGGSDIDLRESTPVDGATIHVFTMFGGCNLIVPPEWNVSINTTAIFGGFDDKRDQTSAKSDFTVYIKGVTIFGGGELKSSK